MLVDLYVEALLVDLGSAFDAYMKQEMARDIYNRDKLLGVLHINFVYH